VDSSGTVNLTTIPPTAIAIAAAVWRDTLASDFTQALSIGKSVMNGVSLGTGLTVNALTTNNDKTGYSLSVAPPTSAEIATSVWQDATALDFTTTSSIGKSLYTSGVVPGGTNGLFIAGTNAATTITTALTTAFTGNLTGNVGGNVSGSVGSVTGLTASDVGTIKTKTDFLPSATAGTAGGVFIAGSNAATTVNITGNITGNLSGSVGSVSGAVGSVTGLTASNLDATISSRMASYTQPTGFLAATFPGTIASPTNITAGTITTTTNLTNLPAIPDNWLTAAGIAASALNGKGDWLLSSSYTSPPSAATIATTTWQDLTIGSDFTTVGSIGELFTTNIDATISSRSTYAGADTSGTTTLLTRVPSALTITSGKVDVNDKTGFSLTSAYDPAKIDIWNVTLPSTYTGQKAGFLLWKLGNRP
jgi:hypothetical protein